MAALGTGWAWVIARPARPALGALPHLEAVHVQRSRGVQCPLVRRHHLGAQVPQALRGVQALVQLVAGVEQLPDAPVVHLHQPQGRAAVGLLRREHAAGEKTPRRVQGVRTS
jgi:hypothetical protein